MNQDFFVWNIIPSLTLYTSHDNGMEWGYWFLSELHYLTRIFCFSSECYCGNKYGNYSEVSESECSMACIGKSTETCGNSNRNHIMQISRNMPSL